MDVIYLDFLEAFDMLPYMRLLNKITSDGVTGKSLA